MNILLLCAGALIIVIGIVHSLLGESLIFKKLEPKGGIPTLAPPPLQFSNIRIIWATWHLVSILGFGLGALFIIAALPQPLIEFSSSLKFVTAMPVLLSGLTVLWATKGKHPGWIGLLMVSALVGAS
jgi:hypothetical protein